MVSDDFRDVVFISSTYLDNQDRRRLVRDAVERAGLKAAGMETFPATDRPTVEECRSRAARCEVFVGIVAHRYGWEPEGGGGKSITWIEYEAAKAAGVPCLMFEIDPAVKHTREEMDEPPHTWGKQEKLDQFKATYARDQLPARFTEQTLHGVVLHSLTEWRKRREEKPDPVRPPPPRGPGLEEELQRYCSSALQEHQTIQLTGFKTKLRAPIDLADLYVPLQAMTDLRGGGDAVFPDVKQATEALKGEGAGVSLFDAFRWAGTLKRKGLVILGEPGSGKTTHLKRLLIWCLREGPEKLGLPADMVPVFLPLRRLEEPDQETVDRFIERQINAQLKLSPNFGQKLLRRGRLLLLFDGLDEVANLERRASVARWVEDVLDAHPSCFPVVTCRFAGYGAKVAGRAEVRLGERFLEMHIQPLDLEQQRKFVRSWYGLVESGLQPDPAKAAQLASERSEKLLAALRDRRTVRVAEMVGNPLLLANLCLVHRDRGRLPDGRDDLFQECVDVLLELWRESKDLTVNVTAKQGQRVLQPVAAWLHQQDGRTRASAEELEPVLGPALEAIRWSGGGARELLRTVRDESGLLTGWGPDQFGFMHLGFQEYLAACELRRLALEPDGKPDEVFEMLANHYGESWWQEVLLLFAAMGNPSLYRPLMRSVVKRPVFAELPALLEMLLEEAAERDATPFVELLAEDPDQGPELWKRQGMALEALQMIGTQEQLADLVSRLRTHPAAEIQDWLVRISAAVGVVTEKGEVELVPIPGGTFTMGSPEDETGRFGHETPRHQVTVSPFLLGRYPVTNEQYGRFLKENPEVAAPKYWGNRRFNQTHQPVVGVTWHDAMAFAVWAGGRLPTEAEWEYACRAGTAAATYSPVLNDIAWFGKNSGGRTQLIGQKMANAWGLHDMLGNVWEWCLDSPRIYDPAPVNDPVGPPSGSLRAVRGGSCVNGAVVVRAAFRETLSPTYQSANLGFRLARDHSPQARDSGAAGRAKAAEPPGHSE